MMWKKAIFLLLISCILLQLASTSPRKTHDESGESDSSSSSSSDESGEHARLHKRSSKDDSSSSSESSEESNSRNKLLSEFVHIFKDLVKSVSEAEKSVAKKFLENKLISKVNSVSVNEIKETFANYLAVDTSFHGSNTNANLISQYFINSISTSRSFFKTLNKYNPAVVKEPNADEVLIQQALEESDGFKLFEEVPKRFKDFTKSFGEKVQDYVSHLSVVEKQNETKLIEWYNEFKSADVADKFSVITKFFDLY